MPLFFTTPTFARAGVVASFVLTPPGLDLVFNPFFESGIGWTWANAYLDTSFYEPIDFCHSSIRLNLNTPTAYVSETTPHPATPGQVYELAVDVFSTGWPGEQNTPPATMPASWTNLLVSGPHEPTGTIELQVQFWDATGLTLISTVTVASQTPTGGLWVTAAGSVTVPAGAAGMTILIVLSGETEQDWWLDNVQLELSGNAFVPDITIGVLFAQGTMYAPSLPPTLPTAPAPSGGALSLQSWLWYNSSSGFYWNSSATTPATAGDALLGWAVTNATGIAALSNRQLGTGLPEVVTPIGPVTAALVPPAPNVAAFTSVLATGTGPNGAYYQFSGTFTNAADTSNVGQVAIVLEDITSTEVDVPVATFVAPLVAGATVNWVSALIPTPTSGTNRYFTPAARSSNLVGAVTSPEVTAESVSVDVLVTAPANVTSVLLSEIGPRWLNPTNQTTWTALQAVMFVPQQSGGGVPLPTRLHLFVSPDNVTWQDLGFTPLQFVPDESGVYWITTVSIPNIPVGITNVTWYAEAYGAGVAIDPGIGSAVESVGCVVDLVGAPSATGATAFSVTTPKDLGPLIDGWFSAISFTTPGNGDPNACFYQVTVQSVDQYGNVNPDTTIGPERPLYIGFNNGLAAPGVLDGTYVAAGSVYTYVRYKLYAVSRSATGWQDPTYSVAQQINGSATYVLSNFGSDPGSFFGGGVSRGPSGGVRGVSAAISSLQDYSFENDPVGAVGATTVSPWTFTGNVTIVSGGAADGAQYCQLEGPSASAAQTIQVRAGESIYVAIYYLSSNTAGSHSLALTLTFFNTSGVPVSTSTAISESGYVGGWSLADTSVAVPSGAVHVQVTIATNASEPSAGSWGIDAVLVDRVRPAANIALGAGLVNDGSRRTTVARGAGVALDGSNNVTLNLGSGVKFGGAAVEAALGSGTTLDGSNNITLLVGSGIQLSGGIAVANVAGALSTSTGQITVTVSAGMQISSGALAANVTGALSTIGGPISVLAGGGLQVAAGFIQPNYGNGVQQTSGQLTLNLSSGLAFSGAAAVANVAGGLAFSSLQIVISTVGPSQISSVNAASINAGTIAVGSGGMTFSGSGGIVIAGSGAFSQLVGAASSQSFISTEFGGTGVRAFYLSSVASTVIDTDANGNFATLSVQGSTRIDASGNVTTNNCNVYGNLNFQGSISSTASAGTAALPGNPVGFVFIQVGGTAYKMPYYGV